MGGGTATGAQIITHSVQKAQCDTMTVDILTPEQRTTLEERLTPQVLHTLTVQARSRAFGTMSSDDLLQDTLLKIARSIDTYRERGSFTGWCMSVLNSTYKNTLNKRSRDLDTIGMPNSMYEDWDEDIADPIPLDERANVEHYSPEVRKAMRNMADLQRAVLILHAEGHSHREIADALGVTTGCVSGSLSKARRHATKVLTSVAR